MTQRPKPTATLLFLLAAIWLGTPAPGQQTLTLTPSRDNTLFDDFEDNGPCGAGGGQVSNGAGSHLFAGFIVGEQLFETKRAVIRFDLSAIPAGSTIVSATLTLTLDRSAQAGPEPTTIHRMSADWGEGLSSSDGLGGGGGGAPAQAQDATWCEPFFGLGPWGTVGGDFQAAASATTIVGDQSQLGPYTWGSTAAMVADVQQWVDAPASNFGWLVRGNELPGPVFATAKRFASREATDPAVRPRLVVGYVAPTVTVPTLSTWSLVALALFLAAVGVKRVTLRRERPERHPAGSRH